MRRAAATAGLRFALVSIALGCLWAAPVGARAEPVSLAGTPLEVQLWPGGEPGYTLVTVTGHIPDDAELPAVARLPLPEGVTVLWSGEILGGPVQDDPVRAHEIVDVDGGRALQLTAETSRTVQYEARGPALTVTSGMTKSVFQWVQSVPTGDVVFSVRLPAWAESVVIDPMPVGSPRINEAGERLYTLRPAVLSEGHSFTVTVAYGREGATGSDSGVPVLPVLAALLVIALFALGAVVARERRRSP